MQFYGEDSSFHDTSGDDVWQIDEAIALRHCVVLPLIRRHNAVVYNELSKAFGVVQPLYTEPRVSFAEDTYFDFSDDVWGYRVAMENHKLEESYVVNALLMESRIVPLASTIWVRGDVYFLCRGNNPRHADAPRTSNRRQRSLCFQYIPAVVSYPPAYPTKASQLYSIFVEIPYAGQSESEQARYEMLEINLEKLRESGVYDAHDTNPPLIKTDPSLTLGDEISIITFTSSGYA
jgi:hypothetical protein